MHTVALRGLLRHVSLRIPSPVRFTAIVIMGCRRSGEAQQGDFEATSFRKPFQQVFPTDQGSPQVVRLEPLASNNLGKATLAHVRRRLVAALPGSDGDAAKPLLGAMQGRIFRDPYAGGT